MNGNALKKMDRATKALHDLLVERHARYDRKKPPTADIATFYELGMMLKTDIAAGDWDKADAIVANLPLFSALLSKSKYAGHTPHLADMLKTVAARNSAKASHHLIRLLAIVRPMASDRVFADNQRVSITRTEHG